MSGGIPRNQLGRKAEQRNLFDAFPSGDGHRRGTLGPLSSDWGDSRSGDCDGHSDAPPRFALPAGGENLVMIGWAYFMAAVMTVDSLLLGLLLLNVKWPKRWKKNS